MNKIQKLAIILIFCLISTMAVSFTLLYAETGKLKHKQVERDLQKVFPKFKVKSLNKIPIKEVYEVVGENDEVVFYSPSGHVIIGDIFNLNRESYLSKRFSKAFESLLDTSDGRQPIKLTDGKYKVITMLSPLNSESIQLYKFLKSKSDLELHAFIVGLSDESIKLAQYIYCSTDKTKTVHEVFTEKIKHNEVSIENSCREKSKKIIDANLKLMQKLMADIPVTYIGDRKIYGYQPFEIAKALSLMGWQDKTSSQTGNKDTKKEKNK